MQPPADKSLSSFNGGWKGVLRHRSALLCLLLVAAALVTVGSFLLRQYLVRHHLVLIRATGYLTVLLIAYTTNVSVFPLPGILSVCAAAALLDPFPVGLLTAIGTTAGESTLYLLGFTGRGLAGRGGKIYEIIHSWMIRYGAWVLFILAVIPNPVADIAGAIAGALRFPAWRFLLIVFVGKAIKFFVFSYACHYGFQFVK